MHLIVITATYLIWWFNKFNLWAKDACWENSLTMPTNCSNWKKNNVFFILIYLSDICRRCLKHNSLLISTINIVDLLKIYRLLYDKSFILETIICYISFLHSRVDLARRKSINYTPLKFDFCWLAKTSWNYLIK